MIITTETLESSTSPPQSREIHQLQFYVNSVFSYDIREKGSKASLNSAHLMFGITYCDKHRRYRFYSLKKLVIVSFLSVVLNRKYDCSVLV